MHYKNQEKPMNKLNFKSTTTATTTTTRERNYKIIFNSI